MSDPAKRDIAIYLAAVTGISVASIAILYTLFVTGFPRFLSGFGQDPANAVRTDPASVVLVFAAIVLFLLLVALIVVFGAKHGPDPENRRERGPDDAGRSRDRSGTRDK